jgi:glycosyltransferase 2 family protein
VRVLTRLTRMARNPLLRSGLLALVLAFCGYGLYAEWPQITAGLERLHWYAVVASLAAAMAGTTCMMLAWRAILADLGSPLPLRAAARINFVSQPAKYVPGAVWAFATQVELGHDLGVPRVRSAASYAVSISLAIGAGLGVAAVALPLASPSMARHYWWVMAAAPLIVGCLCPPVFGRLVDRALKIAKRPSLERRPTWRGLGGALAWTLLGWLLLGVQVWVLISEMAGRDGYLVLAVGGYALAFSAGLLLIVLPGGIGAREVILIAALSSVIPGTAVAVAVMARVVTMASDLACAGLGLAVSRGMRTPAGRERRTPAGKHRRTSPRAAASYGGPAGSAPADGASLAMK